MGILAVLALGKIIYNTYFTQNCVQLFHYIDLIVYAWDSHTNLLEFLIFGLLSKIINF